MIEIISNNLSNSFILTLFFITSCTVRVGETNYEKTEEETKATKTKRIHFNICDEWNSQDSSFLHKQQLGGHQVVALDNYFI